MSRVKALRKIGGSPELNKAQDYTDLALAPVLACPLIDGFLLENIELATGPNIVDHKLDREPRGWFIVSPKAEASIWETGRTRSSLVLNASAPVTLSLWCF